MIVFLLCFLMATLFLIINLKSKLLPIEVIFYWLVNAMLSYQIVFIVVTNLEWIKFTENDISAITFIMNFIYLFPMLTLFFLSLLINSHSTMNRILIMVAALLLHTLLIHMGNVIELYDLHKVKMYHTLIYWIIVFLGNLGLLRGYRRMLRRAGVLYGNSHHAKEVR
ncbi:hypothetical protein [Bacillus sp. PS06]|uniref:hypothetical protein n=1 Tax=Bacillus sp. PS06 TaxID=2764176 RepID=UPI001780752D|nr:hypothetical protein [Bacillus sp. PS06]MBD8069437.1 hypothetical protein [Bacillus sp. PS06]